MYVRALDAEVHDAKVVALERGDERLANRSIGDAEPQRLDLGRGANDHVHGLVLLEHRPLLVFLARPRALGRAASTAALAAASQLELLLDVTLARARHGCAVATRDRGVNSQSRNSPIFILM